MSSIDNINNKRPYIAPTVTAVVFRTERGYASSGDWVSHAANNLNAQFGADLGGISGMGSWLAGPQEQEIYGFNTGSQNDNGLAAGNFTFYNTNTPGEYGWF